MESTPPMSLSISSDSNEKECYLEDFEGRKFKFILPDFAGGDCIGLTCGYLIFFTKETRDFWLVNPITRKLLHFPHFPFDYHPDKAILVYSLSISGWVFVVLCKDKLWFCIEGKEAWKHFGHTLCMIDLYAFKGKIFILGCDIRYPIHGRCRLCELGLSPQPKLTIHEIKKHVSFFPFSFVRSSENLYAMGWHLSDIYELDIGEMKWVKPCINKRAEYAFFLSTLNDVAVAVKRESWADPRSRSHGRFALSCNTYDNGVNTSFISNMWYFPHQCLNVDCIED